MQDGAQKMKVLRTWVLMADGARARLVSAEGHGRTLHVVEKSEFEADHRPNRELRRDKPTRVYESHGDTRHGVEPKKDPHRELKRSFAHEIAGALDVNLSQHNFDRLILVAPPVALGDLRKALSEAVKATIVAEVAMDLTKVPNSEIPGHIEGLIPV
jgi:protein required for attachment to host cells